MPRSRRKTDDTQPSADPQLTPSVTPAPEATPPADQVTKTVSPPEAGLIPLADLPEPSQEVLNAPRPVEKSGERSPTGETWDPAIHEDPPRLSARGSWARRRGGSRAGAGRGSESRARRPGTAEQPPALTPEQTDASIKATAAIASGTLFMMGTMLVGDCMEPEKDEREGITNAFADYFRATGTIQLPPWVGLIGAVGIYVGRRWTHPQFKEKRTALFGGAKSEPVA